MLKHTQLTLSRINQFIEAQLEPELLGERCPLEADFCAVSHTSEAQVAKFGPLKPVKPGFKWGPAYKVVWFRLRGRIPKSWAGQEVALRADVGGERTLWIKDSPERGIDEPHELCRLTDSASGGEAIDLFVQAYGRGTHVRVHGEVLPREDRNEEFKGAELVVVRSELRHLYYDCIFARGMLKALPENDPCHALLLRALNEVCNTFDPAQPHQTAKNRKTLKDAFGALTGEMRHTLFPVGHAHLDTAWLWPLATTHLKMAHTTATQLYQARRYPEYVFCHSQASQYEWLEKEYPKLFRRVKAAVEAGQWEPVGSMWVEADCNLTGAESLVRQFLYGRRYFQKHFGTTTDDMFLPDVFGYSAALPQILNKFGIKYFLTQKISWNQFNKFPHNTFWWQGIDGSRIWSHFPPADTYCGNCTPEEITESVRKHRDHARSDQSLYLFGFGDGGGGPTEQHIELLRRARIAACLPDVESGKGPLDFYQEACAKSQDLAVWAGELYFELHRGTYTSQAANKQANRECEFLLRDIEWLWCFADGYPKAYPADAIEKLWKIVLLNQFHDIIPGSSVPEVYEDSAKDYAEVRSEGAKLLREALVSIGSKLDTSAFEHPIAVFHNSLEPAQAELAWTNSWAPASVATAHERLPVQLVEEFGERKLIFETPGEALGAVCAAGLSRETPTSRNRLKAAARRIENDEWSVRFDPHGNITSIASLDNQPVEFIEPGKLANLFQVFDDRPLFWDAWDVDIYALERHEALVKSESFEIVERGPVRVAVETVKRFGNSTIKQRISLGPTPGIRFDTWVDWRESHKMLKVAFPVDVNSSRATYEIQFGNVERPTHRNTSWDMARFEVCAQKWVDLSDGGHGVALLNSGKYGHDVDGNVMRLTLLRSPKAPDPDCDMGEHRFTYVLLPHYDNYIQGEVVSAAYALNAPPRVTTLKRVKGVEGELPRFLHVDSMHLVVESVKKAEDSGKLVARLYECHNTKGRAELYCARGVKRAWLADLNETPVEQLEVVDGIVSLKFKPFEILTVLLEC